MVQFGAKLKANAVHEWSEHYLDYSALKKVIKRVALKLAEEHSAVQLDEFHTIAGALLPGSPGRGGTAPPPHSPSRHHVSFTAGQATEFERKPRSRLRSTATRRTVSGPPV